MNYLRIYNQLINKAKQRDSINGYYEIHHIIPKSEGGTDSSENLIKLTGREHFIAHKLLWMDNPTLFSRCSSFMMMSNQRGIKWGSVYETARIQFNNSPLHPLRNTTNRLKQLSLMVGKPKSEEHKKKISEANKGKSKTPQHIENMKASLPDRSGENNSNYGKGTPVIVDGIEYINQRTAAISIGVTFGIFNRRLKSEKYPNYQYKNK
jgi:hypothetical protein